MFPMLQPYLATGTLAPDSQKAFRARYSLWKLRALVSECQLRGTLMLGILRVKISNRSSDRFLSPNGPTNPNFCSRLLTRLIRITSKQLEYHGDGSSLCRLKTGSLLDHWGDR